MKPVYHLLILFVLAAVQSAKAQNCAYATTIPSIPFSASAVPLTADSVNPSNALCNINHTNTTPDRLYSYTATTPQDIYLTVSATTSGLARANVSVFDGCPTNGGCRIGIVGSGQMNNSGAGSVTLPAAGTYYLLVENVLSTHPTAGFNLNIVPTPIPQTCAQGLKPTNGAHVFSPMVRFSFATVANASSYDLYLGNTSTNLLNVANFPSYGTVNTTLQTALPPGTYFWYVLPRNFNGAMNPGSCASNVKSFIVDPVPANDNCTGATPINQLTSVVYTAGNTYGSTTSMQHCGAASGEFDDVWYSFVAQSANVVVECSKRAEVYSGNCTTPVSLGCNSTSNRRISLSGLTPGNTYYVAVWGDAIASSGETTTFNLAVFNRPEDECSTAPLLAQNLNAVIDTFSLGDMFASTKPVSSTLCQPTGTDIWYRFTATAGRQILEIADTLQGSSVLAFLQYSIYAGSCGALTVVQNCQQVAGIVASGSLNTYRFYPPQGLIPGNTYYLRLSTTSAITTNTRKLRVGIGMADAPPANDSCHNATVITPATSLATATPIAVNTANASATLPNPTGCATVFNEDDVWYKFTATAATMAFRYNNFTSSTATEALMELFTGSCAAPAIVPQSCGVWGNGTSGFKYIGGLSIGQTYYLNVYTRFSSSTPTLSAAGFNMYVYDTIPAPPPCVQYTAPANNAVLTTTFAVNLTWNAMPTSTSYKVYIGTTPGSMTLAGTTSNTNYAYIVGSTTGQFYWYVAPVNAIGTNTGCAGGYQTFTVVASNYNDEASNAIPIFLNTACSAQVYDNFSATKSTNEPVPGCIANIGGSPVWFKFVAPPSGTAHITLTTGPQYGGFYMPSMSEAIYAVTDSSNYTTFTSIACGHHPSGTDYSSRVSAVGLTPGATYYLQVDAYSNNSQGRFCIEMTELDSNMVIPLNYNCFNLGYTYPLNAAYTGWVPFYVAPTANTKKLGMMIKHSGTPGGIVYKASNGGNTTGQLVDSSYFLRRPYFGKATPYQGNTLGTYEALLFFTDADFRELQARYPTITTIADLKAIRMADGGQCAFLYDSSKVTDTITVLGVGSARGLNWVHVATPTLDNMFLFTGKAINDDAPGAIVVPVTTSGSGGTTYTNNDGSKRQDEPNPGCTVSNGGNPVWHKFIAPASGAVQVKVSASNTLHAAAALPNITQAIYAAADSTNYSTFTSIACGHYIGALDYSSYVYATGLNPGQTYYLQIDGYNMGAKGLYELEIAEADSSMLMDQQSPCEQVVSYPYELNAGYAGWVPMHNNGKLSMLLRHAGTSGGVIYDSRQTLTATGQATNGIQLLCRNYYAQATPIPGTTLGGYEAMLFFNNADMDELKARYAITSIGELKGRSLDFSGNCAAQFDNALANDSLTVTSTGSANGMNWVVLQTPVLGNMFLHAGQYTTGVRQVASADGLKIYPNPATDVLYVEATAAAQIQVIDMAGRVLQEQAVQKGVNTLNVSSLVPGVYMVKYVGDGQKQLYRFTKTGR